MHSDKNTFDNILVFNHDLKMYPPILSVIASLVKGGKSVAVLGYCSDPRIIDEITVKGVTFVEVIRNRLNDNQVVKLVKLIVYQRRVSAYLQHAALPNTLFWIFGNENVWLLSSLVARYRTLVYLLEVPQLTISSRYRILAPFANYGKVMRSAKKVVCCEYNRAHITKSYFGLSELPTVIPNKPEIGENVLVVAASSDLDKETRKILLYQGIFNFPERRLEALCQSIGYLSDDYLVVLMGPDNAYKLKLKEMYESERVKFVSFISPPNHLQITSGAFIGFLTYFAKVGDINSCLNTLYCAPNKIFEYTKYGVPMISNDVPALRSMFDSYGAGICIEDLSARGIADAVERISLDYAGFRKGAYRLYESVNFGALIDSVSLPER